MARSALFLVADGLVRRSFVLSVRCLFHDCLHLFRQMIKVGEKGSGPNAEIAQVVHKNLLVLSRNTEIHQETICMRMGFQWKGATMNGELGALHHHAKVLYNRDDTEVCNLVNGALRKAVNVADEVFG